MSSQGSAHILFGRGRFAAIAALIVFISLVPLNFNAATIPAPNLLFTLSFAILLRRPEFAPFWLLALIFFLADILQMRPLGLWPAIVLVAAQFSRPQEHRFRELPFPFEWAFVTGLFFVSLLLYRIILQLAIVPQVSFGTLMLHFFVTILSYPLVVFFCHYILAIRKFTPGEANRQGQRL